MKYAYLLTLSLCLLCFASAQDAKPSAHAMPVFQADVPQAAFPQQIFYAGGPVMSGATNVYVVFYGKWPKASVNIINEYLQHLGGTTYYNANTHYSDSTGAQVQNIVNYDPATHSTVDPYSHGRDLKDMDVQSIVARAINRGLLPNDESNGVYFVLTAADVNESLGTGTFCANYCGYHSPSDSIVLGEEIKYAFVGNPARCPANCDPNIALFNDATTPNGDVGGDGAVDIVFHELSETVSDPLVTLDLGHRAWGAEITPEAADFCFRIFTTPPKRLKIAPNGAHYNETIDNKPYLIQQVLVVPKKINGYISGYYFGKCTQQVN